MNCDYDCRDSGSEGSSSEDEWPRRSDRRSTRKCYRCHRMGHFARFCPSLAPGESSQTAGKATTDTATIGNYLVMVTSRKSGHTDSTIPSKEGWYLDCAATSQVCGDRKKIIWYTEYANRDEREVRNFSGRKAGKAIGHGDVRLRLRLPGGRKHEVVVRNVLHVKDVHNSLSQLRLMDKGLQIVAVNGYGIKIYDKALAQSTGRGRGKLVGVALQVEELFRLDVKRHRSRKSKRYTAPNDAEEHFYREILVPEEPKKQEISVRNASTAAINRTTGSGESGCQLIDPTGSGDDNESKSEEEEKAHRTDHHLRRGCRLEVKRTEAD